MPVTITPVAPGNLVGPGLQITLQSSFIGPLGAGSHWFIGYYVDTDFTLPVLDINVNTTTRFYSNTPLTLPNPGHVSLDRWLKDGDTVHVYAALHDGSSFVDNGNLNATWSNTAGLYNLMSRQYDQSVTGAYTAGDRLTMSQLNAGMQVSIPSIPSPGGIVKEYLGQLFSNGVPPNIGNRHGSLLCSGDGSISRGTEPFRSDSLGFEWLWHTIPEIWGELVGNPSELERRVVQWKTITHDTSGASFQWEVLDSDYDGVRHMWGISVPDSLTWHVSPGAVVEVRFLVLVLG